MTTPRERALRAALEHAQAEALALVGQHADAVLRRLETRMERGAGGKAVIRFEWEVGAPRADLGGARHGEDPA